MSKTIKETILSTRSVIESMKDKFYEANKNKLPNNSWKTVIEALQNENNFKEYLKFIVKESNVRLQYLNQKLTTLYADLCEEIHNSVQDLTILWDEGTRGLSYERSIAAFAFIDYINDNYGSEDNKVQIMSLEKYANDLMESVINPN